MNVKQIVTTIGITVSALIFSNIAGVALAASVINGSFDHGPNPFQTVNAPDASTIAGWKVTNGSVDWIGNYWQDSDGDSGSIDMNGLAAGTMTQDLVTAPGHAYKVTFSLSGNPDSRAEGDPYFSPRDKVLNVSATGTASSSYHFDTSIGNTKENMMWQPKEYGFVATASTTTLAFSSGIDGAFGPALDNVTIIDLGLKVPQTTDQCKKDGWKTLQDNHGNSFKNQGDCVSFVATGGKNLGAITPTP